MPVTLIVPGVYAIPLGAVNAFLIQTNELTLIDTGAPGSTKKILQAVREIGKQPKDIRHILVTHCHADHAGSLAELKEITGAATYMHAADAAMVRAGRATRPMTPALGLLAKLLFWFFVRPAPTTIAATEIDYEVADRVDLVVGGGIRTLHIPGHCAGQLAFLWRHHGKVLFAADAASNIFRLGLSIGYEDLELGQRSLARLAKLEFDTACFGHGGAIIGGASNRFKQKWAT